jgi:hypothetical protein
MNHGTLIRREASADFPSPFASSLHHPYHRAFCKYKSIFQQLGQTPRRSRAKRTSQYSSRCPQPRCLCCASLRRMSVSSEMDQSKEQERQYISCCTPEVDDLGKRTPMAVTVDIATIFRVGICEELMGIHVSRLLPLTWLR